MEISGIVWLDDIVVKLQEKHGVEQEEVREVLENRPWFRYIENGHRPGENLYAAFGQTLAGRYLIIFFVLKRNRWALVVSARDMSGVEKRAYDRR